MILLSNTISNFFKQILASSCIYFQQGSVWFTSYAGVKKKPFHLAVNLNVNEKKFTPLWNFKPAWILLRIRVNALLVRNKPHLIVKNSLTVEVSVCYILFFTISCQYRLISGSRYFFSINPFLPNVPFLSPWKHQKTKSFLKF